MHLSPILIFHISAGTIGMLSGVVTLHSHVVRFDVGVDRFLPVPDPRKCMRWHM